MIRRSQLASRRRNLGYSQEALAQMIQVSPRTVSAWETGASTPSARHRRTLADALGVTAGELERLIDANGTASVNGHTVAPWLGHYASLEQTASELRRFEPLVLPALMQTERYATAIEAAYHRPVSVEAVRRRVEVRLERQQVLHRATEPLVLHCVIDEAVLHHVIGGRDIMDEQLAHLARMATLPNVHLRVAPFESSPYGSAFGPFHLLTARDATAPYMACTEDLTGMNYLEAPAIVEGYAELFDHLVDVSAGPDESLDLIDRKRSD